MAGGRELSFGGLDGVMPEVGRLMAGHETVGRWSLAQILYHLGTSIRLTTRDDGPPVAPSPRWDARRRRFFEAGRFPEGVALPRPILDPPEGLDERAEADSLAGAIEAFGRSPGPSPAHPLLGPLSKDDWALFHTMHCAHHLAFALPTAAASPTGGSLP